MQLTEFDKYGGNSNSKDNGIEWLLLEAIDALEIDKEWLRVFIQQWKANCESQKISCSLKRDSNLLRPEGKNNLGSDPGLPLSRVE